MLVAKSAGMEQLVRGKCNLATWHLPRESPGLGDWGMPRSGLKATLDFSDGNLTYPDISVA